MRAQQYNQTDLCRPITALEKCQGTDKNYVPTGSLITIMFLPVQAQRSFEMKKAPLLRRAALITLALVPANMFSFYVDKSNACDVEKVKTKLC